MIYLADGAGLTAGSLLGPVLGALGVIAAAVLTTVTTLRTSQRATTLQRQQQLDQRGDVQYERLAKALEAAERERDEARKERDDALDRLDAMRTQRDHVIEEHQQLRYRVWLSGYDPDTIGRDGNVDPGPRI